MDLLHAAFLGLIEGATEFLPISSTGHLILASSLLGIEQTNFTKTFEIAIQFGAICAVVVLYWKSFFDLKLLKKLFVAFIPTAVIGYLLYKVAAEYLLGNEIVVLVSLFVGGVALIAFEHWYRKRADSAPTVPMHDLTYYQALFVGLCQAIAIIPGVSRSGASIIGGLALGVSRPVIVEFSFLLAVPTILAATCLSLFETGDGFTANEWQILAVGFVVSFIVAWPVVKWFLAFVRKNSFTSFGIYRIVLSLAFAAYLFSKTSPF